jgi:hypothetical protein
MYNVHYFMIAMSIFTGKLLSMAPGILPVVKNSRKKGR